MNDAATKCALVTFTRTTQSQADGIMVLDIEFEGHRLKMEMAL